MKFNKLIKTALVCVLSILVISGTAFAYTKVSHSKNITKILTDSQKIEISTDMNKEFENVKQDIKKTHQINTKDYVEIDLNDLSSFTQGTLTGFNDKEFTQTASTVIFKAMNDSPVGSLKPIVLVKNDKKEILVAYKDNDGNNILEKSQKLENGWKTEKSSKNGSLVPSVFSSEN